jgi:hypothetical protein
VTILSAGSLDVRKDDLQSSGTQDYEKGGNIMGDRANVRIAGVHLYTHWGGHELPFCVRDSLRRKWRWTDEAYLARIIFCDMTDGDKEEMGFGISKELCDNEHHIISLNCET